MSGLSYEPSAASLARTVFVAAVVTAAALALYDAGIRQPRTPRLAVVDISRLFAAAERGAKDRLVAAAIRDSGAPARAASAPIPGLQGAEIAALQATADFGPAVQRVLGEMSSECRCTIVASAAVVGRSASIPDFTQDAADRLGVALPSTQTAGRR